MDPTELAAELAALRAENRELRRVHGEQAKLLRALADDAPVVLYAKDRTGRFLFSNRLHAALLGRAPGEVVGKVEADLVGPEADAEIQAVVDEVLRHGEPHVAELSIPLEAGARVFLEHVFPLGARDELQGVGGAAIDITERKQAEASARVFALLAEHSPDGVLLRRRDARTLYANPAMRTLLGLRRDAPPDEAAARLAGLVTGVHELTRPDGSSVAIEVTLATIPDERGATAAEATFVRDVTALLAASREREAQAAVILRQQEALIAELSAPLLPVAPGVLVMPLIGTLDEARSLHLREVALEAVVRERAHALIVDLTGLRAVDGAPADRLQQLVSAVRLVGARVILTGVRAEVAATLSAAGFAPPNELRIFGTLQAAVQQALAVRRR